MQLDGDLADRLIVEVVQLELVGKRALPQARIIPSATPRTSLPESSLAWFGLDEPPVETPVLDRAALSVGQTITGPVIICEEGSTSVIPPDAHARVLNDLTILVTIT